MKTRTPSQSIAATDYLIVAILILGLLLTVVSFSQIH
jgi:hypothetical protein